MGDFFSFRDMITSSWVKVVYFIGAVVISNNDDISKLTEIILKLPAKV